MNRTPLILLHHAGGSARAFDPLLHALPPQIEPIPIDLPGRGRRWREEPVRSTTEVVGDLATQVVKAGVSGEFAIFGHSMGAYLGLALAAHLEKGVSDARCGTLFASANAGPVGAEPIFNGDPRAIDDEEILAAAGRFGGLSPQLLAHEQLRQRTASVLRADFCVCDDFVRNFRRTVTESHVVVCHGTEDVFTAPQLDRWRLSTTAGTTVTPFPGGHFYFGNQAHAVATTLTLQLGADSAGQPERTAP